MLGDYAAVVRPDLWRRYLALILDALRPERAGTSELPELALSPDELTQAMRTRHAAPVLTNTPKNFFFFFFKKKGGGGGGGGKKKKKKKKKKKRGQPLGHANGRNVTRPGDASMLVCRAKARNDGRRSRVTIRDVAQEAGVSIATVSRVVNGHSDVSTQTREAVSRVLRERGYPGGVRGRAEPR